MRGTTAKSVAAVVIGVLLGSVGWVVGAGEAMPSVEGSLVVNGKTVELPHVYIYTEEKGFYDEADRTWTLLFVEKEIAERELDDHIWDSAYLRLGITETAEFGDGPEIQVYSQDIRFSADQPGNVSGGSYPEIELSINESEGVAGRVFHAEPQTFFDDTYQYEFTFSVPMSDPFGPIGDALPAGGGEPGKAYIAWCDAVHEGDLDKLGAIMPAEQAAMLNDPEARESIKEDLEFMQLMTPTKIEILSGSASGETAILQVRAEMEGETVQGEVEMTNFDGKWMATSTAWE